jgi:hypothetical protein
VNGPGRVIERSRFKLPHPEGDEVAWDIVPAREGVQRFARNERLGDLSLELDAMGTVFGHGFQSPAVSVNPNLRLVHRQGHSEPAVNF